MARRKKSRPVKSPPTVRAKFDVAQTTSENRNHWVNADNLSARAALSPAVRRVVRARSRYEAENNSWYAGILNTAANHVIGNGPRLAVSTANTEGNARLERAWRQWARRVDLADQLRIMFVSYWKDGEVFALRSYNARNGVPTDLKTLEADQITTPFIGSALADRFTDDGIRFDADTNELQFYILRSHPGGVASVAATEGEWVRSDRVLHLFRAERPGQVHGIPRVTPSLQQLPIMRRQELATLYSSENVANFSMYLKTNVPVSAAESAESFAEREMARNMLTTLPEGWEIGQIEPKQPGPQYEMFQRQCLMSFGRCTNMPYALLAGTGKDSNFSSMKGDIRQLWEPEVVVEQNRLEVMIVDRLFQWFLEDCVYHAADVLAGMPPIGDIDYSWTWPPVPDVDPIDTANAAVLRITNGISSPSRELARMNVDYETLAARSAADFGVDSSTWKRALFAKHFEAPAAGTVSVSTGDSAASSVADTATNGAQVTSIVEIISQVAAGVIPKATAMALIRSAFPAVPVANVSDMLAPFTETTPAQHQAAAALPQGEYTELGQRAFSNNQKRISKTLAQYASGEVNRTLAETTLESIGMAPDRIQRLLDDAEDGTVDEQIEEVTA